MSSPTLCQCGCGEPAPLAKENRPKVGQVIGQPLKFVRGHGLRVHGRRRGPLVERFWRAVKKADGDACWNWTGSVNTWGYGQVRDEAGNYTTAHRVSYELNLAPIPDGQSVLHRCDNPRCVRPDHLFLGTQADNMADKTAKGRQAKGERHGMSRASKTLRGAA